MTSRSFISFKTYALAFAAVLTPAFLNIDYSGCQYYGDSTLSEFELIIDGKNYLTGFDPEIRSYEATFPPATREVRVRTMTSDPLGSVFVNTLVDGERLGFESVGEGGSDMVVPLPPGSTGLEVWVAPYGGATDYYEVEIEFAYWQNFESLNQADPNALDDDGWLIWGQVSDSSGALKFGYGPYPAPNASADPTDTYFSAIIPGEGGPDQGTQQLRVFNDYSCCSPQGHFNGTDRVQSSVFQQKWISAEDNGTVLELSFDAKRGDINDPTGSSTAFAFIQTFDLDAGYAQTNFVVVDMTQVGATWERYSVSLGINELLVGQLLEFGFLSTASNFEPSGVFYDNIRFGQVPIEVPDGFVATVFYDGIPGSDGIVVASDDMLYVVNEFGPDGPFVVSATRGGTYSINDALSTIGPPLNNPDDLEAGAGEQLFIADGQAQTVFRLPRSGGEPVPFVTPATTQFDLFNPFGVEVVPPGFDGPNVDPGDLIVADNAYGTDRILWAVNQQTGLPNVLAQGAVFEGGPLRVEFGPDGTLYVAENYRDSGGSRIVVVASDGTVAPFVESSHRGPLAVHPNNGDVYFRCGSGDLCRVVFGASKPEPFASNLGSFQGLEFSPNGLSLFVAASGRDQVIEIRGDDQSWGVSGAGDSSGVTQD